jgi:hypothetical protein
MIMPREHVPIAIDRRVREASRNRCGYCLSPQHLVMGRLELEHIIPVSRGGSSTEENLWLSCSLCNRHKSDRVTAVDPESGELESLFNPREQKWPEHFRWSEDGVRVSGITPVGRATVAALRLDSDIDAMVVRSHWVAAGWHPPHDDPPAAA